MADYDLVQSESVPNTMKTKYKDMGDGTHALVVSAQENLQIGGSDIDEDNPLPVKGRNGVSVQVDPTVTAGAYSAGDCVGGELEFANMGPGAGQGGLLTDLIINDDAGQDAELELWLFDQSFTSPGDTAAWSGVSEDDLENCIGIITSSDGAYYAAGTPSVLDVEDVNKRYILQGTSLYAQLVTRGTPTFAATDDISVRLNALID